jgi:hypothetical protein
MCRRRSSPSRPTARLLSPPANLATITGQSCPEAEQCGLGRIKSLDNWSDSFTPSRVCCEADARISNTPSDYQCVNARACCSYILLRQPFCTYLQGQTGQNHLGVHRGRLAPPPCNGHNRHRHKPNGQDRLHVADSSSMSRRTYIESSAMTVDTHTYTYAVSLLLVSSWW